MKSIIAIDYNPGAMGSFLLWNLFKKIPSLDHYSTSDIRTWGYNNHHARPDFKIYNHNQVSTNNILKTLADNKYNYYTLASHNMLSLLPKEIQQLTTTIRIQTDYETLPVVIFFFWYKAGDFMIDYVSKNNTNFVEGMFRQLIRCVDETHIDTSDNCKYNIAFKDLQHYDQVQYLLEQATNKLDVKQTPVDKIWYSCEYTRSMQPLYLYTDNFSRLTEVVCWIYAQLMITKDYNSIVAEADLSTWNTFSMFLDEFVKTLNIINTSKGRLI
jgi:hypothetical protein